MIAEFGFAQPRLAHIVLAIDIREITAIIADKVIIDDLISPVDINIGFFHMDYCGIAIKTFTDSESCHIIIDEKASAHTVEFSIIIQCFYRGISVRQNIEAFATYRNMVSMPVI